jgi:ELWxxDGT repeat protein
MRDFTTRHLLEAVTFSLLLVTAWISPPDAHAQVSLVEDINPGAGGTYIFRAGPLGSAIYFSAYDGVHGEELWVSDGTAVGTYLVKDIWPVENNDGTGAYSSKPEGFIATSAGMYFGASHREDPDDMPNHDYNLWFSTGAVGKASQVPGFELAYGAISVTSAVVFGDDLMISGWDDTNGVELWKVSGTAATLLTDIEPGVGGSDPRYLTVIGSQLFFSASNSATYGVELWVTDGTAGGESVIDFVTGTGGLYPQDITSFDGEAYFSGYTDASGSELWASNGTLGGTRMVADIYPGYNNSSNPTNFVAVGDQLFFTANDGTNGYDLWVYDSSTAQRVKADGTPSISEAIAFDGKLFFVAIDPDSGTELWTSDGTDSGTGLFFDIYPGSYTVGETTNPYSSGAAELTVAGDFLFFTADDGVHGPSLWVTDGTGGGTFMVANLFDNPSEEGPKGLTPTTNRLFFQTESDLGREVHALLTANVVKPPAAPTGEASGSTETAYTYSTTGGSISLDGSDVQYRFNWGDDTNSGWLDVGVKSAEHTWNDGDTYEVTVDAKSVGIPSTTSNSSDPLSVTIAFTESVSTAINSGPATGEIWVEYEFTVTGESDYGHDMEFQVDWSDGEVSEWAAFNATTGETITHDWDELGDWPVTVTLRCAEHTGVTDSDVHWISIVEETIATPTIDGPSTGWAGTSYDFTIGGESSAGHDLEYIVYWGDGGDTGWQPFGAGQTSVEVSHTWAAAETFPFEVGVRCAAHDYLESWNYDHSIEVTAPPAEEITGPDVVRPDSGYIDVSYDITLSASSNLGHDLEYQVDWGDATGITWTAFGEGVTSVQLSHAWEAASTYDMFFEVRCIAHPDKYVSDVAQMFVDPEVVSEISLEGPSSGAAGVSADYVLTGRSASGHAMQYYMDWGHSGAQTGWLDINPATGTVDLSHSWPADGTYHLQYGVRCKTHTDTVQEWSETWVTILGETMATHTLDGPTEGQVGVDLEFTVTATSSDGHDLEYKFDWGDGFPTDWAPLDNGTDTVVLSYAWAYADDFAVTSWVRCATHNHVLSEKTTAVTITSDTPTGEIFTDGFESGNTSSWTAP